MAGEIFGAISKFQKSFYLKEFFDPFKIFQDHLNSFLDDLRFWTRRQMRRNDLDKWVFDNFLKGNYLRMILWTTKKYLTYWNNLTQVKSLYNQHCISLYEIQLNEFNSTEVIECTETYMNVQ